jgi:hypothetical protein
MGRKSNLPDLPPVDQFEVAPHRYLYDRMVGAEAMLGLPEPTYRDAVRLAPYQKGDVVYVVYGDGFTRVYIEQVFARRNSYGDMVEYYRGRRETKAGRWAKVPYDVFPGYIQRGYQRAGLAPEMPKGDGDV